MSTRDFYDALADSYHLLYPDWDAAVERQGEQLDRLIRETWPGSSSVLDAAVGVGTQALGLAARGYRVTGSDVSPAAIARAAAEAARRALPLETRVADLRELSRRHVPHDVVIACDNALTHLGSDAEVATALRECFRCTRPGGGVIVSLCDFGARRPEGTLELHPVAVQRVGSRRVSAIQVREWTGEGFALALHLVEEADDGTSGLRVLRTSARVMPMARIADLMFAAGYRHVERREDSYFQPVVVGSRPLDG